MIQEVGFLFENNPKTIKNLQEAIMETQAAIRESQGTIKVITIKQIFSYIAMYNMTKMRKPYIFIHAKIFSVF